MRYFTVEKEYLVGETKKYEIYSDGMPADTKASEGESGITKIVIALLVNEYDENGTPLATAFYPVKTDTGKEPFLDSTMEYVYPSNEDEVLAEIYNDHPASEWQNNNW